ncbi:hypothetical protein U1Q18_027083 [Sarracenia purpurea var. burkii]
MPPLRRRDDAREKRSDDETTRRRHETARRRGAQATSCSRSRQTGISTKSVDSRKQRPVPAVRLFNNFDWYVFPLSSHLISFLNFVDWYEFL